MTTPVQIKNDYQPFVKWVGGKRGLLSQIIPLLPKNFNNYFEAFLGGGALFFELSKMGLLKDKKVYLFDINSELINAYNVVKKYPNQLLNELENFKKIIQKSFIMKLEVGIDKVTFYKEVIYKELQDLFILIKLVLTDFIE